MHRDTPPFDTDAPERMASAEAARRACIEAALAAWEDAGLQGLCGEGRWEIAVSAMRRVDLGAVVERAARSHPTEQGAGSTPERS